MTRQDPSTLYISQTKKKKTPTSPRHLAKKRRRNYKKSSQIHPVVVDVDIKFLRDILCIYIYTVPQWLELILHDGIA
jgi:hypothetical protein